MGNSGRVLFPLSPGNALLLAFGVVAVLIYAVCLAIALRLWSWLRKSS
jgi:hypothetical protein